jgi:hypothetical protein
MRMTNESIAKAIGWRLTSKGKGIDPLDKTFGANKEIPDFLGDLNVIVATIKKMKLCYRLMDGLEWNGTDGKNKFGAAVWIFTNTLARGEDFARDKSATRAMCAALLTYIKNQKEKTWLTR